MRIRLPAIRVPAVAALLVALAVAPATPRAALAQVTAQAGPMPAALRVRLDGRLDARTRAAVERVIDSAHASGIPADPLVDKALEGVSKRAPGEAIVRAVRGLAVDLATARQALGAQSEGEELAAGASALRAGVDVEALRQLRHDRPGQPLVIALSVLADLIASNVPVPEATRSVLALTSKGIRDEQLVAFRRDVERDIGIGAPPGVAAALRAGGGVNAQVNLNDGVSGINRGPTPKPKP